MKYLRITMIIFFLATPASTIAGQAQYDDCILDHLRNSKLDVVTHLIKQACQENYKDPGFTSDKKRAYNNCLLGHLVGVESIQAAMDLRAACDSKYK